LIKTFLENAVVAMLNYQSADSFFEHCLEQCGLTAASWQSGRVPTLAQLQADQSQRAELMARLQDIKQGADAVFAKGRPAEDTLELDLTEWERRWVAWTAARTAAFHSRAALFLLGERAEFDYLVGILRSSQNLVFLSGASDALQHGTGHYLSGPNEELTRQQLAEYWAKKKS
jgi:hypothetical protein